MNERTRIRIPFTNSEGAEEIETLWAIPREDGYELDNIPFHAQDLALGDVVSARPDEHGALRHAELVRPSGHSTIQLWFARPEDVEPIRETLRQRGCASELSELPRLVAVDVPPEVPYPPLKAFLDEEERNGRFEYQEACLGFD